MKLTAPIDPMLAEIANALHVETNKIKSWWPIRRKDGTPRSLVIRLADGKQICAGMKKNTDIWLACQPALIRLDEKKSANNGKRVSHKDIEIGVKL